VAAPLLLIEIDPIAADCGRRTKIPGRDGGWTRSIEPEPVDRREAVRCANRVDHVRRAPFAGRSREAWTQHGETVMRQALRVVVLGCHRNGGGQAGLVVAPERAE